MHENEERSARRWEVSCHEAGHAVCALLLGYEGVGAVVYSNGSGLAANDERTLLPPEETTADDPEETLDADYRFKNWDEILRSATLTAAGYAGVDLLMNPDRLETNPEAGSDRRKLDAMARKALGTVCDPVCEMSFAYLAAARARALLKPVLRRLRLVAIALNDRGRLTADEVVENLFPEQVKREVAQ